MQRNRIKFFIFKIVIVFLLPLSLSHVRGNPLHEMITGCQGGFNEKAFSDLLKDSTLILKADGNGFLPIDLLIFEIKKLGEKGTTNTAYQQERLTPLAEALVQALVKLSRAMVNQDDTLYPHGLNKLHTGGLKVIQTFNTQKGLMQRVYTLSPLGFLVSPVAAPNYTLKKDRTLLAGKGNVWKLSILERLALRNLWQEEAIRNSIDWKKVTCVSATDKEDALAVKSTPFHNAVRCGDEVLVQAILGVDKDQDKSEYFNALDEYHYTPLMRAIYTERILGVTKDERGCWMGSPSPPHSEVLEKLLQYRGIPLDERCKASRGMAAHQTPLEVAVSHGFVKETKMLLDKGARVDVPGDTSGMNIFHRAAMLTWGTLSLDALEEVIAKYPEFAKTALNEKDAKGNTPLYYLLDSQSSNEGTRKEFLNYEEACKRLLGYGADLTALNENNQTFIHLLGDLTLRNPDKLSIQKNVPIIFTLFKEHAKNKGIDFSALLNKKDGEGKTLVDKLIGNENGAPLLQMVKENGGKGASKILITPVKEGFQGAPPHVTPLKTEQVTQQPKTLQETKSGDNPLRVNESSRSDDPKSIFSNRWMQGTLATAAGLSLFFIAKKFFKKEKKEEANGER